LDSLAALLVALVAALMVAAEVRFTLTKTLRFVEAGPGLAALAAGLGVAFLAGCLAAAVVLTVGVAGAATGFFSGDLDTGALSLAAPSSSSPFASSLASLSLFFSLQVDSYYTT